MNHSLEKKDPFLRVKERATVLVFLLGAVVLLGFLTACDQKESAADILPSPTATQEPQAFATAPPQPATSTPTDAAAVSEPTSAPEATSTAQSLSLDEFYDVSYWQLLRRNPELISSIGLAETFGTGNDRLTDISDSYIRETQALEAETLDQMMTYDRSALTPEQQISYDIYHYYLDDLVDGHDKLTTSHYRLERDVPSQKKIMGTLAIGVPLVGALGVWIGNLWDTIKGGG